jgi:hypothetical protein
MPPSRQVSSVAYWPAVRSNHGYICPETSIGR